MASTNLGCHVTFILRGRTHILLGIALLIALGFEFVNGFHDTANAVATVIYTNSMSPNLAVVWSGFFNFTGVLVSTGAVAFGIVSLLPVVSRDHGGESVGLAMGDGAQSIDGLGAHAAGLDRARRRAVLAATQFPVGRASQRDACAAARQACTRSRSSGVSTPAGGASDNVTK